MDLAVIIEAEKIAAHKLETSSLSPLPDDLRRGLIAIAFFGFLSLIASLTLFVILTYRIVSWRRQSNRPTSQFVLLIYNLVIADIQQSVSFMLAVVWLARNGLEVGTRTCWAQAWFVSVGDLASGVWCFAIGVHTFASILFNYRLSPVKFHASVLAGWAFVYGCNIIVVSMHPNIFVRAGAWCWVDSRYESIRLWLHYFWIFIFEFGTIIVYAAMFIILRARIRSQSHPDFATSASLKHASSAAKLMVVYPIVYVVCTLPLASARVAAMAGHRLSIVHLCVAGAMITSNGWLDVLLYTMTRRIMIFSDEPPPDTLGIDTFQVPFWSNGGAETRFGTTTVIEATGPGAAALHSGSTSRTGYHQRGKGYTPGSSRGHSSNGRHGRRPSVANVLGLGGVDRKGNNSRQNSSHESTDELWGSSKPSLCTLDLSTGVQTQTTVEVTSDPLPLELVEYGGFEDYLRNERGHRRPGDGAESPEDAMNLNFQTKPDGY
ncbi:hypothetical protein P152DRAFT_74646 [Eremomyces bilateralis CBS 781.70]|uniref:Integral membrane protein-like protein n=1 Tax=Eremomyces bilateralis CBS 781.70 TaxID=1392243 RepID=A0A6G1FZ17_9PEZI|nr:uncharacterized protein P152DRAFT_74646 [Eremomyces bilateralis CBS 781.70]KAF1811033.1 hypothetical protein P152DRAFT_74646 [Eremomyces bilateralis CBS 781.70]